MDQKTSRKLSDIQFSADSIVFEDAATPADGKDTAVKKRSFFVWLLPLLAVIAAICILLSQRTLRRSYEAVDAALSEQPGITVSHIRAQLRPQLLKDDGHEYALIVEAPDYAALTAETILPLIEEDDAPLPLRIAAAVDTYLSGKGRALRVERTLLVSIDKRDNYRIHFNEGTLLALRNERDAAIDRLCNELATLLPSGSSLD